MSAPNLSAEIDPKLKERVQKKLKKNKLTMSYLITEAFKNYLKNG